MDVLSSCSDSSTNAAMHLRFSCSLPVALRVIFGMMGVINLAHGEFIMCGAYVTVATARAGLPLPIAILSGALAAGSGWIGRRASCHPPTL